MLDWLGDLGGLLDALLVIGAAFVAPFASYSLKATLLTALFRYRKADDASNQKPDEDDFGEKNSDGSGIIMTNFDPKNKSDKRSLMESLKGEFRAMHPIKWISCLRNCFKTNFLCKRDYNKLMNKSQNRVMKELDLKKFITR